MAISHDKHLNNIGRTEHTRVLNDVFSTNLINSLFSYNSLLLKKSANTNTVTAPVFTTTMDADKIPAFTGISVSLPLPQ